MKASAAGLISRLELSWRENYLGYNYNFLQFQCKPLAESMMTFCQMETLVTNFIEIWIKMLNFL